MLRCLESFNPVRYCFTTADFDNHLLTIDGLLRDYEKKIADPSTAFHISEKKQLLEDAYALALICLDASNKSKPDKQLIFLIGDILRQYGHLCYADSFLDSKQILLASLNMQLYAIDLIPTCFDMLEFSSLDDLKKQAQAKPNLFSATEDLIPSTQTECCVLAALTNTLAQGYPSRRLFNLADTVRWLGHCYQRIDSYCALNSANDQRFAQLFDLSEALLLIIDDERSRRELGDLYFRAWPFMHQRKHPEDVDQLCALYKKALSYDPSPEMQARVANMCFLCLSKAQRNDEAFACIKQAVEVAKKLSEHGSNRLLIAEVHNNYASHFMDTETLDLKQAEECLNVSLSYAAKCRQEGEDHVRFAAYDMRFAEIKLVLGEFEKATEAIERAIGTLKKIPPSKQALLVKAESLKCLIAEVVQDGLERLKN